MCVVYVETLQSSYYHLTIPEDVTSIISGNYILLSIVSMCQQMQCCGARKYLYLTQTPRVQSLTSNITVYFCSFHCIPNTKSIS